MRIRSKPRTRPRPVRSGFQVIATEALTLARRTARPAYWDKRALPRLSQSARAIRPRMGLENDADHPLAARRKRWLHHPSCVLGCVCGTCGRDVGNLKRGGSSAPRWFRACWDNIDGRESDTESRKTTSTIIQRNRVRQRNRDGVSVPFLPYSVPLYDYSFSGFGMIPIIGVRCATTEGWVHARRKRERRGGKPKFLRVSSISSAFSA
jgi:hypothetical protein